MSTWYNNYYLNYNINNANINYYYDLLKKNNSVSKNIESKIDMIEVEYQTKFKEITDLCNDLNKINEIKNKSCLKIIQTELEIIKLLTKYSLQNKKLDYELFIKCLNVILDFSEILRVRLGQKKITENFTNNDKEKINRFSYKFCSYQDNCTYNYNQTIKKMCYQDHYVHNMVSSDIINLINYINYKYNNEKYILHSKEILKTINTLSYVIGHMEHELKTKCLYLSENEWDKQHFIKYKN